MELLGTLLLALPTIFLAAFLAAVLENARERIRTRKWVMRNLQELAASARSDPVAPRAEAAVQRWLDAESPDDLDEPAWRQVWLVVFSNAPDLSPLVRGEAATSVPAGVFTAIHHLEEQVTTIKQLEAFLNELFGRDVAPLWYERRVPLTGSDRRRVTHYRDALATYRRVAEGAQQALDRFRAAVAGT